MGTLSTNAAATTTQMGPRRRIRVPAALLTVQPRTCMELLQQGFLQPAAERQTLFQEGARAGPICHIGGLMHRHGRTDRVVAAAVVVRFASFAGTLAVAGALLAGLPQAQAATPPDDQVIPHEPPMPVKSLLYHMPGVAAVYGVPGVSLVVDAPWDLVPSAPDATQGQFLQFAAGKTPGPRVVVTGPALVPNPVSDVAGAVSGATFSLWYRHRSDKAKVTGWNPILLVGDDMGGDNYRYGIVLAGGVPIVARAGNSSLFVSKSMAVGIGTTTATNAIDDGLWHHLALRLARPGCSAASCPQPDFMLVTLFVDGNIVGETLTSMATSSTKTHLGWMKSIAADAAQVNYDATNKRINTHGDIVGLHVYGAALSPTELSRLRMGRTQRLRWQWPPLAPTALGWQGTPATIGKLPSTPQAVQDPPVAALLLQSEVKATGGPSVAAALVGERMHTLAAWIKFDIPAAGQLASEPPLLQFFGAPTASASDGWNLYLLGNGLEVKCGPGAKKTSGSAYVPHATGSGPWHLVTITTKITKSGSADVLTISMAYDQRSSSFQKLTCEVAAGFGSNINLGLPMATARIAWAALYAGALDAATQAAIAAPGPALWLPVPSLIDLSGLANPPSSVFSESGTPFSLDGTSSGISKVHIYLPDRWLARTADNAQFTATFDLRIDKVGAVAGSSPWVPLLRRHGQLQKRCKDFELLALCQDQKCQLVVRTRLVATGPVMQNLYTIGFAFPVGANVRVAVTSPLTRTLYPEPGLTGAIIYATEPGVTVNGISLNRRYSTDANLLPTYPYYTTFGSPPHGQYCYPSVDTWTVGDVEGTNNVTRYKLTNLRLYPRALQDTHQLGATCSQIDCAKAHQVCVEGPAGAGPAALCGSCAATAFDAGGAGEVGRDCRPKRTFAQPCRADVMCLSGKCASNVCAASATEQAACDAACQLYGRQCADVVGGAGAKACGGCLAGFAPAPGKSSASLAPADTCAWSPTKKWGQDCTANSECVSGACRSLELHSLDHPKLTYSSQYGEMCDSSCKLCCNGCCGYDTLVLGPILYENATLTKKVCLAADTTECENLPLRTSVKTTESLTRPDGTTGSAYRCATSTTDPCASMNYERGHPVLDPSACAAAAKRDSNQQIVSGSCSYDGCVGGFKCCDGNKPSVSNSVGLIAFKKVAGLTATGLKLTATDLKLVFLGLEGEYIATDYEKLRKAGVGDLLISYALSSYPDQIKMVQQYGAFQPLRACSPSYASIKNGINDFAYHRAANFKVCVPKLQPVGVACPPMGELAPGRDYCASQYCHRQSKTCARGGNPLESAGADAGNKNREGKSAVKFGIVRVDDTAVVMNEEEANNDESRYTADVSQKHVPCVLGQPYPSEPLFELKIALDREQGPECASTEISTFVVGIKLSSPKPETMAGSCTVYKNKASVSSGFSTCKSPVATCKSVDPGNLASVSTLLQYLIPPMTFCPNWETLGLKLPELKKDFKEFLVPLYVSIGLTLESCVSFEIGLDDQGLPQVVFTPNLGVGVTAKGGVGSTEQGAYEIGAGVRLALTIVDVAFPIMFGVKLVDVAGHKGLFSLDIVNKIDLELSMLGGEFGLFAEFSVGPLSIEWVLNIFTWDGFLFAYNLVEEVLFSTTLDLWETAAALTSAAAASCDTGPSSPCYQ